MASFHELAARDCCAGAAGVAQRQPQRRRTTAPWRRRSAPASSRSIWTRRPRKSTTRPTRVVFSDVTISQGEMRVQADHAHATGLNFDNSKLDLRRQRAHRRRAAWQPALRLGRRRVPRQPHPQGNHHRQAGGVRAEARRLRAGGTRPCRPDRVRRRRRHGAAHRATPGSRMARTRSPARCSSTTSAARRCRQHDARAPISACTSPSPRAPRRPPARIRQATRAGCGQAAAHATAMTSLRATGLQKSYKSRQVVRDLSHRGRQRRGRRPARTQRRRQDHRVLHDRGPGAVRCRPHLRWATRT